ncbi:MAG: proteobacterial dedicated sortase system histidine kinase, partial [Burkholderiales bacterium]|nr:proteobacterial dedicated sortase system histidine kinase [Burkholderiales bacterium]
RAKLLLASGALLLIPWLGYRFVLEMEHLLRAGQEQALADTARAIAAALNERPAFLRAQEAPDAALADELVPALQKPVVLDGRMDDWIAQGADVRAYGAEQLAEQDGTWHAKSLSFSHAMGRYDTHLYAAFDVTDDRVLYCSASGAHGQACDHVSIALASGERYLASAVAPGPLTVVRIIELPDMPGPVLQQETRIAGVWRETAGGYVVELRMPGASIGRPAFAVVDFDDPTALRPAAVIATAAARGDAPAATAFSLAPELRPLIEGMAGTDSRIRVVDRERRIALDAEGPRGAAPPAPDSGNALARIEEMLLLPLYRILLPPPATGFDDPLVAAHRLEGREIESALAGEPAVRPRQRADARDVIVSAAHPVRLDGAIVGAVVVEQTTRSIGDIRRRALERLLAVTLATFALAALSLLVYASRLSLRIRRLRDEAEWAIDPAGRVRTRPEGRPIGGTDASDELGDLSRSLSQVLDRLAQYTGYLESMARRLGHELRTPIAVVRSSLDNLRMQPLPSEAQVYLERADAGLTRLNAILSRMSEANRLEQIMRHSEREQFDLRAVVAGCVEGYRGAYAHQNIRLTAPDAPVAVSGVPDLIAQLLDKLVENAVDFSAEGTPIEIELRAGATEVALRVRNEGTPLPAEMAGRLFDSMVSVRTGDRGDQGDTPHLGLGLYIVHLVALFHHGRAEASNREDGKGVEITVRLPRYVSDPA